MKCGWIYSDSVTRYYNFVPDSDSEKNLKSVNIWWRYKAYKNGASFFWPTLYSKNKTALGSPMTAAFYRPTPSVSLSVVALVGKLHY